MKIISTVKQLHIGILCTTLGSIFYNNSIFMTRITCYLHFECHKKVLHVQIKR